MLILWGMAGMSERSERLVGGQIQPFFNYNPANGGSPPLVHDHFPKINISCPGTPGATKYYMVFHH